MLYIDGAKAPTWRVGSPCIIRIVRADPRVNDAFKTFTDAQLIKFIRKHHERKSLVAMLEALAKEPG